MAVGDILQVTTVQAWAGGDILNTWHFRVDAQGSGNGAAVLAGVMAARIAPLKALMSNAWTYRGVLVQKILPKPPEVPVFVTTNNGPGGVASPMLTANAAICITKRTLNAGRFYRGRVYISGFPESVVNDGQLDAAQVTGLTTWANDYTATSITAGWTFTSVLLHRSLGSYTPTTTMEARPVCRNQRRRQIGKGS